MERSPVSSSVNDSPERPAVAVLGRDIAALRRERGRSLGELARRAEVGKARPSEIESGRRNATIETLYALTTALGVPLSAPLIDVPAASDRLAPLVAGETVEAELVAHYRDAAIVPELYRIRVRAGKPAHHAAHAPGVHKAAIVFAGELRVGFGDAQIENPSGTPRRSASTAWRRTSPLTAADTPRRSVQAVGLVGPSTARAPLLQRQVSMSRPPSSG
jgi:transcriptional regulator with XRE-family HTH domain